MSGRSALPGELMGFQNWKEVQDFSQTIDGAHLAVLTRLMDNYGIDHLNDILDRVLDHPSQHALTISTTHKAKGLEWGNIFIDNDFMIDKVGKELNRVKVNAAQVRLLYVALTRAKLMSHCRRVFLKHTKML